MTTNEINIMAGGGRCIIKTHDEHYLGINRGSPCLVDTPAQAHVYDYVGDNVPNQLATVKESMGYDWTAEPAPNREAR
jgi:hypothetical protein